MHLISLFFILVRPTFAHTGIFRYHRGLHATVKKKKKARFGEPQPDRSPCGYEAVEYA